MLPKLVRDFAVILLCVVVGKALANLLPIAFPGSIIGMVLLFILLSSGLVQAHWVERGSSLLIKYMAVMFVPIGVGLINYLDLLEQNLLAFLLSSLVSTFVTMALVGLTYKKLKP